MLLCWKFQAGTSGDLVVFFCPTLGLKIVFFLSPRVVSGCTEILTGCVTLTGFSQLTGVCSYPLYPHVTHTRLAYPDVTLFSGNWDFLPGQVVTPYTTSRVLETCLFLYSRTF